MEHFGNAETAFTASVSDLVSAGIEPGTAEKFVSFRFSIDIAAEQKRLQQNEISLLSFFDDLYPELLKEIPQAPPLLYYRGAIGPSDELALAVVGTRKITAYGRTVTPQLLDPVITSGVTLVSGLAYGIDALAHTLCIKRGKRTIAVLACGIDDATLYPRDHVYLAQQIMDCGGMLMSEYPPGTPAFKQHFVARNRIMSGMSLATLVVECSVKSGTFITVKHALDQNRQVLAVPGPVYGETSQGPNNLIKMGATAVTEAGDIFAALNIESKIADSHTLGTASNPSEYAILELLSSEPKMTDELVSLTGLSAPDVSTALTFLEMKGMVRSLGGGQYVRAR